MTLEKVFDSCDWERKSSGEGNPPRHEIEIVWRDPAKAKMEISGLEEEVATPKIVTGKHFL